MSDIARFTELLFADQTLDDLLGSLDGEDMLEGVWMLLAKASAYTREAEPERASKVLLEVAASPNIESRILLWSWAALRRLGVHPEHCEADKIRGIVMQIPMESGVDVLAAYDDGTARYINHSGKVIVWDIPDAVITSIIHKLLECSKSLRGGAAVASSNHSITDLVRITLLTFNGNKFNEEPVQSTGLSTVKQILAVGAELMANLIKRSEMMDMVISNATKPLP